jgi:hypothetical protein
MLGVTAPVVSARERVFAAHAGPQGFRIPAGSVQGGDIVFSSVDSIIIPAIDPELIVVVRSWNFRPIKGWVLALMVSHEADTDFILT